MGRIEENIHPTQSGYTPLGCIQMSGVYIFRGSFIGIWKGEAAEVGGHGV